MALVVDDEALIRMMAADFLADEGYKTIEAADGAGAILALAHHPEVMLLVTDVNMPGEPDGLQLAALARERDAALSIIVTSGKVVPATCELPTRVQFVSKPYQAWQLIEAVARSRQRI